MRQVISVSLNGRAYQLEDDAYAVLRAYLEQAERALAANPDRVEIVGDLERAIADKCNRHLSAFKTVVTRAEISQVIEEMGPVEAESGSANGPAAAAAATPTSDAPGSAETSASPDPAASNPGTPPKRLYQIRDGARISGVCNGIAAYFGMDVTLVRVAFVIGAFLSGGLVVGGYLVLSFILPYAHTSEELAAAHGQPFNARVVVEQARQKAAEFAAAARNSPQWQQSRYAWKREWRQSRAEWREARAQWRQSRAQWRNEWRQHRYGAPPPSAVPGSPVPPVPPVMHAMSGVGWAILGIVVAAVSVGWILWLLSLLGTGAYFNWGSPHHWPWWVWILALCLVWNLVFWPIRMAHRIGGYPVYVYRFHFPWSLVLLLVLLWYAVHHAPQVHEFIEQLKLTGHQIVTRT